MGFQKYNSEKIQSVEGEETVIVPEEDEDEETVEAEKKAEVKNPVPPEKKPW